MGTMGKFRNYALWIIGFFIISVILENALVSGMYKPMGGTANGAINFSGSSSSNLDVTVGEARATNMNGYVDINVKNTTGHDIDKCCVKLDLYTARGNLAATKYIDVSNFAKDATKTFRVKFNGSEISSYEVTLVEDAPDKTYIVDFFGWEIDVSNVFGLDFSNIIDVQNVKEAGLNVWNLTLGFLKSVPTWAYIVSAGIVIWYLPSGYLFGII